jgi:hypothetical protein
MQCFYHPGVEAVGICKNCLRGICQESLTESDNALACKEKCEERVERNEVVWRMAERGYRESRRVSTIYSFVLTIASFILMFLGWEEKGRISAYLFIVLSLLCFLFAGTMMRQVQVLRNEGEQK